MILQFTIDGKEAAIHTGDISMILTDVTKAERGVLYTGTFPTGVTADQSAVELIAKWILLMVPFEEDDEEEEDELLDTDGDT